jgi:hypothetical protein
VLSVSCKNDEPIVATHQYNERSSGDFTLTTFRAIVVQNQLGPVIIEGSSQDSTIGWFLDKWVTAESQTVANQVFSQFVVSLKSSSDTAYIDVQVPVGMFSPACLLSLTVPDHTPCILRKVGGTSHISYLQSTFVGENLSTTTVQGHEGACMLSGLVGDVSVEMALPDSGLCRVIFSIGNITLRIPATTSSILAAQTGNGSILYSGIVIGDTVRTTHSLTGRLGTGRGNIQLTTGKGNISIAGF